MTVTKTIMTLAAAVSLTALGDRCRRVDRVARFKERAIGIGATLNSEDCRASARFASFLGRDNLVGSDAVPI